MIIDLFKSKMVDYAKSHQSDKLEVVRFFLAQVKNKEIELRPKQQELTDDVVFKVLKKLIKQTEETIEMCEKGDRSEALAKANAEKAILTEFTHMFPAEFLQEQARIEAERQQKAQNFQQQKN